MPGCCLDPPPPPPPSSPQAWQAPQFTSVLLPYQEGQLSALAVLPTPGADLTKVLKVILETPQVGLGPGAMCVCGGGGHV